MQTIRLKTMDRSQSIPHVVTHRCTLSSRSGRSSAHLRGIFSIWALFFFAVEVAAARDLQEIKSSGYLLVGVREAQSIYSTTPDGEPFGFCWELAAAFAQSIGVLPRPVIVESSEDYWVTNGRYPAAYDRMDIVADLLAVTPERRRLANLVHYIDITEIFVTRKGDTISGPEDMIGRSVAVYGDHPQYNLIKTFFGVYDIPYFETASGFRQNQDNSVTLVFPRGRRNDSKGLAELVVMETRPSDISSVAMLETLLEAKIDTVINNSLMFLIYYHSASTLRRYFSPSIPLGIVLTPVAFGVSHHTPSLGIALASFVRQSKTDGQLDGLLKDYTGLDLREYYAIVRRE